VKVDGIIPGIYSVTVSGTAIDTENSEYYINGNSVNAALFHHGSALNIEVQGLKVSPLIFMEIYESTMRQIAMYRDIEISEKQIEAGQIKDARTALRETRAKYGL
jgi:hypothetical protein